MPVTGQPVTGYATVYDLVTGDYATNALAAGGVTLTSAQSLILPTLVTAASREIIRYCGRSFRLSNYDEILTPEGGRQDRGEPASVKLSCFPVQSLSRVATGRATVLTVSNTDQVTNQFASVAFAVSGDVEYNDLTYTGLNLNRTASGTLTTSSLSFTTYPTVNSLAGAVNALGNGWTAKVGTNTTNSGLLATTELVGVREPKNAFSPGACLDAFTCAASSYDIDRSTGIMRCYGNWGFGWGGAGAWGDSFGGPSDGLGDWGVLGWGQWRVSYTAGFATVPENVAQVCAELIKASFERLKVNSTLQTQSGASESENWAHTVRQTIYTLPEWCLQILSMYRDNWI